MQRVTFGYIHTGQGALFTNGYAAWYFYEPAQLADFNRDRVKYCADRGFEYVPPVTE